MTSPFKFFIAFLILTASIHTACSQNIFSGYVVDSVGNPLSNATVMLYGDSLCKSKMVAYAMTNRAGKFTLSSDRNNGWILIRHLGYQNRILPLKSISNQKISLREERQSLEEIVVKGHYAGVRLSGDTVMFDAEHFKNGFEENVSQLLQKLPGVSVDEDGTVSYGGKIIGTILLDGKDVLTQSSNGMLVNNMQADIIRGVEVIRHYKSNNPMSFNEESDGMALNLKTSKHSKFSGYADGKYGYDNRYRMKTFGILPSEKFSLMAILSSNNIGEPALSFSDYIRKKVSHSSVSGNDVSFSLTGMEAELLYKTQDYFKDKGHLLTIDSKYVPSKNLTLILSTMLYHTDLSGKGSNEEIFFNDSNDVVLNTESANRRHGGIITSYAEVGWRPLRNLIVQTNFNFLTNDIHLRQEETGNTVNANDYNQLNKQAETNFDGNFLTKLLLKNHTLKVGGSVGWHTQNRDFDLSSAYWYLSVSNNGYDDDGYFYHDRIKTHRLLVRANAGDEVSISKNYLLDIHANFDYSHIDDYAERQPNDTALEIIKQLGAEVLFKKVEGKLRYSLGLGCSVYSDVFGKFDKAHLFPRLDLSYSILKNKTITVSYNRTGSLTDFEKISRLYRLDSYYSLTEGADFDGPFQISNQVILSFSDIDAGNNTYIFAHASWERSRHSLTPHIMRDSIVSITRNMIDRATNSYQFFISCDKRYIFGLPLDMKMKVMAFYMTSPSVTNGNISDIDNEKVDFNLKAASRFKFPVNVEISCGYAWLKNHIKNYEQEYITRELTSQARLLFNKGNWRNAVGVEYQTTRVDGYDEELFNLNFSVEYKFKRFAFSVKANNLLHLKTNYWRKTRISEYLSVSEYYRRMPGYLMAGVKYNI
jgi:hypothetical protein